MPPPLWHYPIAIMQYCPYTIVEKFSSFGNAEASQCAPAPEKAHGWHSGDVYENESLK